VQFKLANWQRKLTACCDVSLNVAATHSSVLGFLPFLTFSPLLLLLCCHSALSENLLPGAPLGVDILGSRVVLFREEASGTVYCLDDTCPHRWVKAFASRCGLL
jgi:hypothetical protein